MHLHKPSWKLQSQNCNDLEKEILLAEKTTTPQILGGHPPNGKFNLGAKSNSFKNRERLEEKRKREGEGERERGDNSMIIYRQNIYSVCILQHRGTV